jgi:uncharacterized membrane protein
MSDVSTIKDVPRPSPLRVASVAHVRLWLLVVWTSMVSWSVALFATVRSEYLEFRLARFDLGNMVQAVWSTAHGRPLEISDAAGEQVVRFASHVDPILVLFAPVWLLAPSPLTLVAVQVAACALGALPLFWLGRRHLESETAAGLLALAYLSYPWLVWTALDAMHPVTLGIPLLLFAIWFLDSGRMWAFALCALLALSTGELMGLAIAGLGLWFWLARGHRSSGIAIGAVGLAWTAVCLEVVIPAFRGESSPYYERFESVGGSPGGVVRTALSDPGTIVSELSGRADLTYLLALGMPLGFAFLLAPGLALVALPQLLVNALSDFAPTTSPRTHYVAAIIPFLFAASVFGLTRLTPRGRSRMAGLVLAASAAMSLLLAPWDAVVGRAAVGLHDEIPASHVEALREAVSLVPRDAPVTATNRAGSHLSDRRYYYSVDVLARAEWIVLDTWDARVVEAGWQPARLRAFWNWIERSTDWTRVYERDGVLVFRRETR